MPPFLWVLIDFVFDISTFWIRKLIQLYKSKSPLSISKQQLEDSDSYAVWMENAKLVDKLNGSEIWRHNYTSTKYDYKLVADRLNALSKAYEEEDIPQMVKLLRSGGFLRNFGGITSRELYCKSYTGTKTLIEDYILQILKCLEFINEYEDDDYYNNQFKLEFFHDARLSFGSSCLVLQGGSLFGLCHLGVVKGLYFSELLPRIISGSAVGAVVAALVCSLTNENLGTELVTITEKLSKIDRLNNDVDERYGSVIENVLTKGYSQDILIFMKYVRDVLGDLTFEEAFIKTGKTLNIIIHPTDKSIPSLLNYVTTPNIVIWSAVYASIGTGILSDNVELFKKDLDNRMVPIVGVDPAHVNVFLPPQRANERGNPESPYTRVTELFNVNNFIVSLARPYLAPLIVNDIKHSSGWKFSLLMKRLFGLELQHRVKLLDRVGLLFNFIKRMAVDEQTPKSTNDITIVPELRRLARDFKRVFDVHRLNENIPYWILVGERSVWPVLPILWTRCVVEFRLDMLYDGKRKGKRITTD